MRQKGRTMTELRAENTVKRNEGTAGKAGSGSKDRVRVITVTGVLSAVAFLLQLIESPLPMLMPTFGIPSAAMNFAIVVLLMRFVSPTISFADESPNPLSLDIMLTA